MTYRQKLPVAWTISQVRQAIAHRVIVFVVPSYLDGRSIIEPLASLWAAANALGLGHSPIILSDSGDSYDTVDAARDWARSAGAPLQVNHSNERRSQKAALNAAFVEPVVRDADLVVVMVSDVTIVPESLAALLGCLLEGDRVVAFGVGPPDRRYLSVRSMAGAWLMDAVVRWARSLPAEDAPHVLGAFWAARRELFDKVSFTENQGSLADDVFLAKAVHALGLHTGNAWAAEAVGLPRGTLKELAQLIERGHVAVPTRRKLDILKIRAASVQAILDPRGFILYVIYRIVGRCIKARLMTSDSIGETWDRAASTLRQSRAE